ncbi:unnamed protein product [Ilex paraguariensis]|uniref:Gustatory receptor n=1 Tax=Ilex paraguariensis TaxID=185542 RepID=A0ABC8RN49_9AQUA
MAATRTRAPGDSSIQVSLIQVESDESQLDQSLQRLEIFLRLFGFCQYSPFSTTLSWLLFALTAVGIPILIALYSKCSDCEKYEIREFEFEILIFQAIVAFISLLGISHNLRKYGLRKLLFVDRCHGHTPQFRNQYIQKIQGYFRKLVIWISLCFLLKTAREVTRIIYLHHNISWLSVAILFASLVSWTYSATLYLSGTALFNLTTGNIGIINLINAGDFAVLSIVQLVGIVLCLAAAAKISHRAQGLGSVASRWHALVTCNSNEASQSGISTNDGKSEAANAQVSLRINYSESDLESTDYVPLPTDTHLTSHMSSYHKRQAFVTYVQSNTGGFTVFGWMVDRILINTIFFIELSLVFFVLGKTITVKVR